MTAGAPVGAVELVHLDPADLLDPLDDELGDAITPVHLERFSGVEVHEHHFEFPSIPRIDEPG